MTVVHVGWLAQVMGWMTPEDALAWDDVGLEIFDGKSVDKSDEPG